MTEQEEFEKEAKKMPKIDMTKIANVEALDSGTRKAITAAAESSRRTMKKKFNFAAQPEKKHSVGINFNAKPSKKSTYGNLFADK